MKAQKIGDYPGSHLLSPLPKNNHQRLGGGLRDGKDSECFLSHEKVSDYPGSHLLFAGNVKQPKVGDYDFIIALPTRIKLATTRVVTYSAISC